MTQLSHHFLTVLVGVFLLLSRLASATWMNVSIPSDQELQSLHYQLFPNQTVETLSDVANAHLVEADEASLRAKNLRSRLLLDKPLAVMANLVDDDDGITPNVTGYIGSGKVSCVVCQGLDLCDALNGFMIQEVYLPLQPQYRGTCTQLEERATRFSNDPENDPLFSVFGYGRTFRNTEQCRSIVMQYLCLWWGSDNSMYRNECQKYEDSSNPNPAEQLKAPRPPCRSFCVQVAEICANDPDFMQLCSNVPCEDDEADGSCNPSPFMPRPSDPNAFQQPTDLGCVVPQQEYLYGSPALPSIKLAAATHGNVVMMWTMVAIVLASIMMLHQ